MQAVCRALQLQQGSPQVLVNAHHLQQLLDTLKAFQALLGCQVRFICLAPS